MQGELLAERFRLGARLGAGGMGEVWAAEDERMGRDVAVKLVQGMFGAQETDTQARFRREVQLAGRLAHQNIVTVHDWGEASVKGRPTLFLVMELVQGVSLDRWLKETTPGWPLAVGWAVQMAEALHAAHRQGVVHRDIKPANALLTADGVVKVLDFGVAKFMGETIAARELTLTGAPLGSPLYMSPEQAEGAREVDHRSDLYSLGCLLYRAVTGRPPFTSNIQWAVLRMQMEDTATAPAELVEGLPAVLNDLILHLLAKRPQDRPADAAAVYETLTTLLVDHAVTEPGGNIVDITQLGHRHSVSGQILKRAWELFQRTERNRQEAERLYADALAESNSLVEKARADADELLAHARRDAAEILKSADERRDALTKAAEEQLAAARAKGETFREAQRIVEERKRELATLARRRADINAEIERITAQLCATEGQQSEEAFYQVFRQSIDGSYPTAGQFRGDVEAIYGITLRQRDAERMVNRFTNRHTAELQEDHIV
ncbi:protein kinase [Streptomyces sp. NPDC007971]|uniref:serine/threonine-protein kinase n=1 Tax=Streptomyces sp. NPDC007971 TaxID=3364799 RepID=UPI0036E6AC14